LKVAQTFAEPKKAKIPSINSLLKPGDNYNRPCFDTAFLGDCVKLCLSKLKAKCPHFWATFRASNSSQIRKIAQSGHLVSYPNKNSQTQS
jgi:hypothetical protein